MVKRRTKKVEGEKIWRRDERGREREELDIEERRTRDAFLSLERSALLIFEQSNKKWRFFTCYDLSPFPPFDHDIWGKID